MQPEQKVHHKKYQNLKLSIINGVRAHCEFTIYCYIIHYISSLYKWPYMTIFGCGFILSLTSYTSILHYC